MRRPGIRNERGTQVGASRRMPEPASMASRTRWVSVFEVVLGPLAAAAFFAMIVSLMRVPGVWGWL